MPSSNDSIDKEIERERSKRDQEPAAADVRSNYEDSIDQVGADLYSTLQDDIEQINVSELKEIKSDSDKEVFKRLYKVSPNEALVDIETPVDNKLYNENISREKRLLLQEIASNVEFIREYEQGGELDSATEDASIILQMGLAVIAFLTGIAGLMTFGTPTSPLLLTVSTLSAGLLPSIQIGEKFTKRFV